MSEIPILCWDVDTRKFRGIVPEIEQAKSRYAARFQGQEATEAACGVELFAGLYYADKGQYCVPNLEAYVALELRVVRDKGLQPWTADIGRNGKT